MDQLTLNQLVSSLGGVARQVYIRHLSDLEKSITSLRRDGLLSAEFDLEGFAQFRFKPPAELPEASSIMVIAYPHYPTRFRFIHHGVEKPYLVPPTYLKGAEEDQKHIEPIAAYCRQNNQQLVRAVIPKKLAAVCCGLGEYGRNNIVYVKGMGSFARLAAYYSDMPCEEDVWHEPVAMPRCADCRACLNACPTQAIATDRFLLHAERCITWWNEKPASQEFPDWLKPEWHNCLVGCMVCQFICPENKPYVDNINEGPCFSEEETNRLLSGQPLEELPVELQDKLNRSGLVDYYEPRNFRVLLERE